MQTNNITQIITTVAIIIIALCLLPLVVGVLALALKLVVFCAIVYALFWGYKKYVK